MFWKSKKLSPDLVDLLSQANKKWMADLSISFNYLERQKVARNKSKNNLLPIHTFLDRYENILLNNRAKPGFSVRKGMMLLDKWQNPIYKKLAIIDSQPLRERLIQKNKDYVQYSIIFQEKNIDKVIYIIREIKEYHKKKMAYSSITTAPAFGLVWNLLFWIILIAFNTIIVYGGLLSNGTVTYSIFERHWWTFVPFVTNLLYGTYYIDSTYIKILAYLKTGFFLSFTIFFLYTFLRSAWEITSHFRSREVDMIINEAGFLKVLKMKIKILELEGGFSKEGEEKKKMYVYQNFIDLFRESALYSLNKGYSNSTFTNNLLQTLTLYTSFRRFPEKIQLTEGFQNLLILIFDGYYAMLNGSNTNFNMSSVLRWIEDYEREVQEFQWEKKFTEGKMFLATISNIVTTWTIITILMMSLSQGSMLERLIKLSMD